MGQEITAIITKQKIKVPKDIVHFFESFVTIIPLDISKPSMDELIDCAVKFDDFREFSRFFREKNEWVELDHPREHSSLTILDIIESLDIHTFALEYYSEFGMMPAGSCFLAVIENKIMKDSAESLYIKPEEEKYMEYVRLIGMNPGWVGNEDRYYFYSMAKKEYFGEKG